MWCIIIMNSRYQDPAELHIRPVQTKILVWLTHIVQIQCYESMLTLILDN